MKALQQSIVIVLTIGAIFAITHTQLIDYTAQILGILIIFSLMYIVIKKRQKKDKELFVGSNMEFFAITAGILLTIFMTDGLYSNLFFLVYFLLFGITFMFEPITVFVFLIGLLALFIEQAIAVDLVGNIIRLGSLLLISPIAFFFGKEFKRREQLEKEIEAKSEKIIDDIEIMVEEEGNKMTGREMDAAEDIATQANELREDISK